MLIQRKWYICSTFSYRFKTVRPYKASFFLPGSLISPIMDSTESIENRIRSLAQGLLPDSSLYLVGVEVKGDPRMELHVTVLADGDEGIGIDQVVELTRALSAAVEEQNIIEGPWNLEVSSPGVDMPLQGERQYRKNIDRQLKVDLTDGTTLEGRLADVLTDGILLELKSTKKKPHPKSPEGIALAAGLGPAPETRHIAFADVAQAIVQVVF